METSVTRTAPPPSFIRLPPCPTYSLLAFQEKMLILAPQELSQAVLLTQARGFLVTMVTCPWLSRAPETIVRQVQSLFSQTIIGKIFVCFRNAALLPQPCLPLLHWQSTSLPIFEATFLGVYHPYIRLHPSVPFFWKRTRWHALRECFFKDALQSRGSINNWY